MQEPTNRNSSEKTTFTVLKVLLGLCNSGKLKVEAPRPVVRAIAGTHVVPRVF